MKLESRNAYTPLGGVKLEAIPADSRFGHAVCSGCYGEDSQRECHFLPECQGDHRMDGRDVIWVKAE